MTESQIKDEIRKEVEKQSKYSEGQKLIEVTILYLPDKVRSNENWQHLALAVFEEFEAITSIPYWQMDAGKFFIQILDEKNILTMTFDQLLTKYKPVVKSVPDWQNKLRIVKFQC